MMAAAEAHDAPGGLPRAALRHPGPRRSVPVTAEAVSRAVAEFTRAGGMARRLPPEPNARRRLVLGRFGGLGDLDELGSLIEGICGGAPLDEDTAALIPNPRAGLVENHEPAVLEMISAHPGGVTTREVADARRLTLRQAGYVLTHLHRRWLVTRSTHRGPWVLLNGGGAR